MSRAQPGNRAGNPGRRQRTAEAGDSYALTIKSLKPFLGNPECLTGTAEFRDGKFPITVRLDTSDPANAFLELTHRARDERTGDPRVSDRIRLTWTRPTYGGRRWWFLCPRTGRRVAKLFLPRGGRHFWCRQAYGLGHACQREGRFDRLQRRAATLNLKLGGEGWRSWDQEPEKPKGMRWRTYDRRVEQWRCVVDEANEEYAHRLARLLGRLRDDEDR